MAALLFWTSVGLIGYSYAGYPLVLALLAQFRPKPCWQPSDCPSATLIIAAHNEEQTIARKLDNALALDYPPDHLQILVAVDGAEDATHKVAAGYSIRGVELDFSPERKGKMAAINRVMPKVTGEIIVFSDANNFFSADTLRELVKPFSDPTVGAVTGSKNITKDGSALGASEGLYWRYESFIKQQETRLGCCTGVAGEILAVRKSLFRPPPDRIINDDFYLATDLIKRGYRVIYAPQARSFERVSATAADEIKRRTRIIAGRYQALAHARRLLPFNRPLLVWQLISHKFLRPLVPFAMIAALSANLYVVLFPDPADRFSLINLGPPFGWILLGLQTLFYGAAWLGSHRRQDDWLGKILYLPTFLVNSNWAALVGFFRYLSGRQTALWERVQRRE